MQGDNINKDKILREFLSSGLVISLNGDLWQVEKRATTICPQVDAPLFFATYEEAVNAMNIMFEYYCSKLFEFKITVRYNRGLGVEYKNLPNIQAKSRNEAKKIAEVEAVNALGTADIKEIRVRQI